MKHTSISGGTGTNILTVIPQSAGQNAWVQGQSNQVSATTSSDVSNKWKTIWSRLYTNSA